jgi:hypothetical protein
MRCVRATSAALIAAAVVMLSACSSSAADPAPAEPVAASAAASSAVASDAPAADTGEATEAADAENGDNFAPIVIEQVAKVLTPTPTYVMTSETSVEYTFPSGSATDGRQISHCQIGVGAIGDGYDVTMTYPDGSVRCADLLN